MPLVNYRFSESESMRKVVCSRSHRIFPACLSKEKQENVVEVNQTLSMSPSTCLSPREVLFPSFRINCPGETRCCFSCPNDPHASRMTGKLSGSGGTARVLASLDASRAPRGKHRKPNPHQQSMLTCKPGTLVP